MKCPYCGSEEVERLQSLSGPAPGDDWSCCACGSNGNVSERLEIHRFGWQVGDATTPPWPDNPAAEHVEITANLWLRCP